MARHAEGKKRSGPFKDIKVCTPLETYLRLEKILTSNFTRKAVYGQRSQIITALIQQFCARIEAADEDALKTLQQETPNVEVCSPH
jgi:transcriptional regulator of met regulon